MSDKRQLRFTPGDDIVLCTEAVSVQPMDWAEVAHRTTLTIGKEIKARTAKERVFRLIQAYVKGDNESLRRSVNYTS